jgi:hypothetical protein
MHIDFKLESKKKIKKLEKIKQEYTVTIYSDFI